MMANNRRDYPATDYQRTTVQTEMIPGLIGANNKKSNKTVLGL